MCLVRLLKGSVAEGFICGCAVGVCGVAAAVAVKEFLPKKTQQDQVLLCVIVGVTSISSLAMLVYPVIGSVMVWTDQSVGLFLGASIHDVAHVVGAGYILSQDTGDTAVYMKMLRVALLVPIVCMSYYLFYPQNHTLDSVGSNAIESTENETRKHRISLPYFVIGFVLMILLVNTVALPTYIVEAFESTSGLCFLLAMVAVGVKVDLGLLFKIGKKVLLVLTANTLFLALLSALLVSLVVPVQ